MLKRNNVIPVGNVPGFWPYEDVPVLGPSRGDIVFAIIRERRSLRPDGGSFTAFLEERESVRREFPQLFPSAEGSADA